MNHTSGRQRSLKDRFYKHRRPSYINSEVSKHINCALVEEEVKKCHACLVSTLTVTREPLNMSPLPTKPWTEVSTDFGKVPGHDIHFMVISDDFSRYPVVDTLTALTARAIIPVLDKVISQFGVMETLKSDNRPPFNSQAFADFAEARGFKH